MENMENNIEQTMETETAEAGSQQKGKMFTQEEVNGFLQNRIAREKAGMEKKLQAEHDAKMAELDKRELQITATELLTEKGLPKDMVPLILSDSAEEMERKLELLTNYSKNSAPAGTDKGFKVAGKVGADPNPKQESESERIRAAMGLQR